MKKLSIIFLLALISCQNKDKNPVPSVSVSTEPSIFYISSVKPNPINEISIKNNTGASINIGNYTLSDSSSKKHYLIAVGIVIHQGQTITYPYTTLGFQINSFAEKVYLKDINSNTVDTWSN